MKKYAIVVAGGTGKRFGADIPKQFVCLCQKPILLRTLTKIHDFDNSIEIIVVLPEEHLPTWKKICCDFDVRIEHKVVVGGNQRFFSVKNGLDLVENNSLVAIHDGVRCLVSFQTLENCFLAAQKFGNAVPVIVPTESIRIEQKSQNYAIDRNFVRIVQTPQVFLSQTVKKAYNQPFDAKFTDDASVVESLGENINLVEGNIENIKITNKIDLVIAKNFLLPL